MKVLLVQDYGAPFGGAEIMLSTLRDALRDRGHDARVLVSSAGLAAPDRGLDYVCYGTLSRMRTLVQTANPSAARTLRRALDGFRPDVVHVRLFQTQLSPLILPLLRSVPALYHVQWYKSVCPKGTKLLPTRERCALAQGVACLRQGCVPARDWPFVMAQAHMARHWHSAFDAVVAVSERTKRLMEDGGYGVDEVVWNGVPERVARGASVPDPVVAYAGRLVAEKGVDVLVRAFARVVRVKPQARLTILGDGPERTAIERLIAELGLADRVDVVGRVSREDVERTLERAWVQVVPGLWDEPFGLVTAEALMRGTPLVVTAVGGALDMVVDGERGLVVPPGDERAIADAVVRLLDDRDLAARLASEGHRFASEHLTTSVCVDRFLAIYRRLVAGDYPRERGGGRT
jgi:glycosyltransferase involved in cell wall biosynthesis